MDPAGSVHRPRLQTERPTDTPSPGEFLPRTQPEERTGFRWETRTLDCLESSRHTSGETSPRPNSATSFDLGLLPPFLPKAHPSEARLLLLEHSEVISTRDSLVSASGRVLTAVLAHGALRGQHGATVRQRTEHPSAITGAVLWRQLSVRSWSAAASVQCVQQDGLTHGPSRDFSAHSHRVLMKLPTSSCPGSHLLCPHVPPGDHCFADPSSAPHSAHTT